MKARMPLGPYPVRITDCLDKWAVEAPDRAFLAQRDRDGDWKSVTYAQAYARVRGLAQALLERDLSPDRPILILSGNGIDHGLLALAAMYVGVPYAPIAPAYSLQAREYGTLGQIFDRMRPGLIFAENGVQFERALKAVLPADAELVVSTAPPEVLRASSFEALAATRVTGGVDAARDRVGPDTIAKVLFTSGSTGRPKGVINTQRMLTSNQE